MILVLGAGVAGLAAARTLAAAGEEFLVLEKEADPGGHCRSLRAGAYTFDLSGHFLHLADPALRGYLTGLRGVPWTRVVRDARVWLRGVLTPYPFQANLRGHEPDFVARCLRDFAAERVREAMDGEGSRDGFAGWLRSRFGREMCRAFFFPYNRKMWRVPLDGMTSEWTDWAVPIPRFEELLEGIRGRAARDMGYNAAFYYPREGGIGSMARALAVPVKERIATGVRAESIDLRRRVARTADGKVFPYRAAVATVPLPELALSAAGLPAAARAAASSLRWVKVLSLNLGVRRPGRMAGHWVYVPERSYPFFRVGFTSNVAPAAAPPGCAALFAEKSFPAGARVDAARELDAALRGLRKMGILERGSRIEEARPVLLDPAYVVFDRARRGAVPALAGELSRRGVFPAGRYGAWDYFGMERSVADGIRAAREAIRYARERD